MFFKYFLTFWIIVLIARLFSLQVLDYGFYSAMASDQRDVSAKLFPERGEILLQDKNNHLYPLATNEDRFLVYADTSELKNINKTTEFLADKLYASIADEVIKKEKIAKLKERLQKENDPFEPLEHGVVEAMMEEIKSLVLPGIHFSRESFRFYPLGDIGSHLTGFVGDDDEGKKAGRYGLEAYFNDDLQGKEGYLKGERDVSGRYIPVGLKRFVEAENGTDVVLTVDRNIEYVACTKLNEAVKKHGADGGSVIILEPKTGKILAMCGAPDFDPNNFRKVKDAAVFNNPVIFNQYEAGSVMKVITMAAALDTGAVTPETTYEDTGGVRIGPHVISNSDNKAHGVQTMTQVLEQSLNTGVVFAVSKVGLEKFRDYLGRFGFGKSTGIDLPSEAKGDIGSLYKKEKIYLATAAFGQGISVTPLQLAAAVGAIANEGKLMKPYLVAQKRNKDDVVFENYPEIVAQVISPETSALLSGMMVRVVENGHGKQAGVSGYFVAGKTGTAQIPLKDSLGYEVGANVGTFVGFAPVDNPRFVMVTRLDRPKDVKFAESTAAPLFGEIAQFLLNYMEVKPTRK